MSNKKDKTKPVEKENEKKKDFYTGFIKRSDWIAEAVEREGIQAFLCYNKEKGFWFKNSIEGLFEIFKPASGGHIPYKPYRINDELCKKLISTEKFSINYGGLYKRVFEEFNRFQDIEKQYKELETIFTLETYQQHKLNTLSYLYLYGDRGSGKTNGLFVMSHLAYRPFYGMDINEANVFNYIGTREEGLCTILEDESQLLSLPQNRTKMGIYRAGYKRGAKVPRILEGGSKLRQQNYYNTYCSKAFAGYYLPKDNAFKDRCIPIPFVAGKPEKDEFDKEDIDRMETLKGYLLVWRMMNYFKPLPKVEFEFGGRTKEVWKGKLLCAINTPAQYTLLDMAKGVFSRQKIQLHNSLTAHVVKAVRYLCEEFNWKEIEFAKIWKATLRALEVTNIEAYTATSVYSENLGFKVSKKAVGRILGDILHGEPHLRSGHGRTWIFEKDNISKLIERFDLKEGDWKALGKIKDINEVNDINNKMKETNKKTTISWEEFCGE